MAISRLAWKNTAAARKKAELTPEQQQFIKDNEQYKIDKWGKISAWVYLAKNFSEEIGKFGNSDEGALDDYGSIYSAKDMYDAIGQYFIQFINKAKQLKIPPEYFDFPAPKWITQLNNLQKKTKKGSAIDFMYWLYGGIQSAEGNPADILGYFKKWSALNNNSLKKEAQADLFLRQHLRNKMRRLAQRLA